MAIATAPHKRYRQAPHEVAMEFQRFTAPDAAAHEAAIAEQRARLAAAQDDLTRFDATADLAGLLTTARCEAEALTLLEPQREQAAALSHEEAAGWFWNAYATALQYLGRRDEAEPVFAQALSVSQAGGWRRLQSFVLQHWGRSLVEQGAFDAAQARFEEALMIRRELDDPRTSSTERALAGLAEWRALVQGSCHCGAVRLTLPWRPDQATRCNCSLCRRTGGVWAYFPVGSVQVEGHPAHTTAYVWGDKTMSNFRCVHCGSVTHWEPLPDQGNKQGVNLNNFDPALLDGMRVRRFDGAQTWAFLD